MKRRPPESHSTNTPFPYPTLLRSGYEAYSWSGRRAPAGTPAAIVKQVNADLVRALSDPATAKGLLNAGAEPEPGTPEEFGAFLQGEIADRKSTRLNSRH